MPKVPVTGQDRIQETLTPAPPAVPTPSLEAFGGGEVAAGVSREVQANLQQATKIAADEQVRIQRAKHRDLDDQLVRKSTEFKTRLASVKGLGAQDEYDAIQKEYEDFHREITKDVSDNRLLEATRNSFLKRSQDLDAYSQRYILVERRSYEKDKFEAHQEGLHESALARHRSADGSIDFEAIQDTIEQRTMSLFDRANEEGWSAEELDVRARKMASTTHRDVIKLMTLQQDDVGAQEYFKQFKGQMNGEDITAIQPTLTESSVRRESQRQADRIMTIPGISDEQRVEEARKLEGDLRDRTVKRVKARIVEGETFKTQREERTYEDARRWMDQNPGLDPEEDYDPDALLSLPSNLRDRVKRAFAVPKINDKDAWLEWGEMAADVNQIGKMSRSEFENWWVRFDGRHRETARNDWISAQKALAAGKPEEYKSVFFSDKDMVRKLLGQANLGGIKRTDTVADIRKDGNKKLKAYDEWLDRADIAFRQDTAKEGKVPDEARKRKILRDLILDEMVVEIDVSGWNPETPIKDLTAEEVKNVLLDFERLRPPDVDRIQKNALVVGVSLDPEIEEDQVKMTRAFVAAIRFRDTKTGDRIVAEILRGEQ